MKGLATVNPGSSSIKVTSAVVIASLFGLFVLQNTEVVEIKFLIWKLSVSRVLLLIGASSVGCLVGILIGWAIGKKAKPEK